MIPSEGDGRRPRSIPTRLAKRGLSLRRAELFPIRPFFLGGDFDMHDCKFRKRLAKDCSEAVWALNWMHGEGARPPAELCADEASRRKSATLQQVTQRRIEEYAYANLRCDSAIHPEEALSPLLKGRSLYGDSTPSQVAPIRERAGVAT
jgi:hypothetical protein